MTNAVQTRKGLPTYRYKACPRCQGDLVLDRHGQQDWELGEFEYVCLQCGRNVTLATQKRKLELAAQRQNEDKAA